MSPSARSLSQITAGVSALFSCALFWAAFRFESKLALSQGADSLLDVTGAIVLAWVVSVARAPGDERHPMGHTRAEPLGALAIAILAGILAFEVGSEAIEAIRGGERMTPSLFLLGFYGAKVIFKALVWRTAARGRGPAFSALLVDARNDCLVCSLAICGYFAAHFGTPAVDAWIALPAALWIGWSGISLARENVDLLMGVAPTKERQTELLAIASSAEGVRGAHDLLAHFLGTKLSLHVHVAVDSHLTVKQAHDIGESVRRRLQQEEDVGHCWVHVDPADG